MLTALKQVSRDVLPSIGRRSSLQRKALNQKARRPRSIDRMTYSQRQAFSPAAKSGQLTPLKEKQSRTVASKIEMPYLRIFPNWFFIESLTQTPQKRNIGYKFNQIIVNFVF